jgi:hypothetical protein
LYGPPSESAAAAFLPCASPTLSAPNCKGSADHERHDSDPVHLDSRPGYRARIRSGPIEVDAKPRMRSNVRQDNNGQQEDQNGDRNSVVPIESANRDRHHDKRHRCRRHNVLQKGDREPSLEGVGDVEVAKYGEAGDGEEHERPAQ